MSQEVDTPVHCMIMLTVNGKTVDPSQLRSNRNRLQANGKIIELLNPSINSNHFSKT